jgi:hypothetical protein
MPGMSQTRRTLAIVVLFLTPLPYATIAWLVVKGDDEILGTPVRTLDGEASQTDGSTQT